MILLFAVSWSGGKDCCAAYWKAVSEGLEVRYLLNTYREDSGRVAFHGIRAGLVRRQAEALGVSLIQRPVGQTDYEEVFLGALEELRSKGVDGVVFGDIDVRQNREWCERVCDRVGLDSMFPLWNLDQKALLSEFIQKGFKAIVVAVDSKFLSEGDLGRRIDLAWLERIEVLRGEAKGVPLTYCGENGEYHSFVYGGPCFSADVQFVLGPSVRRDGHILIDVLDRASLGEDDFSTASNI